MIKDSIEICQCDFYCFWFVTGLCHRELECECLSDDAVVHLIMQDQDRSYPHPHPHKTEPTYQTTSATSKLGHRQDPGSSWPVLLLHPLSFAAQMCSPTVSFLLQSLVNMQCRTNALRSCHTSLLQVQDTLSNKRREIQNSIVTL